MGGFNLDAAAPHFRAYQRIRLQCYPLRGRPFACRRRIERSMTTDAVTMVLAVAALAVRQWRGRQATLRALGELRKSMARLETLLERAVKAKQATEAEAGRMNASQSTGRT